MSIRDSNEFEEYVKSKYPYLEATDIRYIAIKEAYFAGFDCGVKAAANYDIKWDAD